MRKLRSTTAVGVLGVALALPLATLSGGSAVSAPGAAPAQDGADASVSHTDNLVPEWRKKYDARRQVALERRLRQGGRGPVERLGDGTYAKVANTGTDKIFVVLAEFGDTEHSAYPDGESDAQRVDGPMHNEIPKPDRTVDNSTLWKADYSKKHYENMYFNRMKRFYEKQSVGRYSVDGAITEWVKVPFNQARYGRDKCGGVACSNTWFLIRDGLAYWTEAQLQSGKTMAEVQAYLRTFDQQDRYDFDDDGNFDEPDGYIDHFQVVHAGGDQADGDPIYGEDAIWSHRWNAQVNPLGTGPDGGADIGGVNVGEGGVSDPGGAAVDVPDNPTGIWVNDYTIQPENGGLGVFAHEFAHDLGLPDLYDTGGAENSWRWWALMAQSRGTLPQDAGIGDRATPFSAWSKFQLGWLDYDVARAGRNSTHRMRPAQKDGNSRSGVIVLLPDKVVPQEIGAPCGSCGEQYYYSESGNDLDHTMTRSVADGGPLTAKVKYEIEDGWDYAFLQASSDGGATWEGVPTSESWTGPDDSGLNADGTGISGNSGGWVDLTADVPAGTDTLRWRYRTDGAYVLPGFQVDEITLAGESIGTAETDEGWAFDGFRTTTGTEEQQFLNAYIVDNRQFKGRGKVLGHNYNFGFGAALPDKVEFFSYTKGMLVSYWDTSYSDNNVGDHPGAGQVLPVDAHPRLEHTPDGALWRPGHASYDATFGLERARQVRLHHDGTPYRIPGAPAVPVFDDTLDWWYDNDEHGSGDHVGRYQPGWFGVDVPKTGTTIEVVKVNKKGTMTIKVGRSG